MKKLLISARNRLILALAGRSPVVLNCEWDGTVKFRGPHAFSANNTVRPA